MEEEARRRKIVMSRTHMCMLQAVFKVWQVREGGGTKFLSYVITQKVSMPSTAKHRHINCSTEISYVTIRYVIYSKRNAFQTHQDHGIWK